MFEYLLNTLPIGICVVDECYQVTFLNRFFLDRTPREWRENYKGKTIDELFPEQQSFLKRRIKSVFHLQHPSFSYWEQRPHIFPFKSSRPITGEETQMYQNMEIIPAADSEGRRLACIVIQDVTALASYYILQQRLTKELQNEHDSQKLLIEKLHQTQSQLIQSEKMASTGQLAAGIAHEINNPIGFVQANLETLEQYTQHLITCCQELKQWTSSITNNNFAEDLFEREHFDIINQDVFELMGESKSGLSRIKQIVSTLKQFALHDTSGEKSLPLKHIANQVVALVNAQYKDILFHVSCTPEDIHLECEADSIKQALMNLVLNGAQAITGKGIVKICISENHENIQIKIVDTGCGIEEKNVPKIFDPFFTTKPEGQGLGLGLSVTYTTAKRHNGDITVSSSFGKGTVITLTLPQKNNKPILTDYL